MSRWKRVVLIVLGTMLACAAVGAVYQAICVRRDAKRFPPPGRLVDIGGRRLHFICLGEGEPTVIIEPGGFQGALSSRALRTALARHTRVCSYDHMGMGWSDPGPGVISIGMLVDDLERLTDRAGIRPPYILVPSSAGGPVAELFARRHPDRVAGLVFVDAGNSGMLEFVASRAPLWMAPASCLVTTAAWLGVLRLIDPFDMRRDPPDVSALGMFLLYRAEPMATMCGKVRGVQASLREFREAPPLPRDVPLKVLVHERPDRLAPPGFQHFAVTYDADWHRLQESFAARSTRGSAQVVPGSSHQIAATHPDVVTNAVLTMVADARAAAKP